MKLKFLSVGFYLVLVLGVFPALGQGTTECTPAPIPYPIPFGIDCSQVPGFDYDLGITPWDPLTHRSADIRIGYSWSVLPPDDMPRFFFFESSPGTYSFYTPVYSQFMNNGGGFACPNTPADYPVSVSFDYTPGDDPNAVNNPATVWTHIGDYPMTIPTSPGALAVNGVHQQSYPVCWQMTPAGTKFPVKFIIKAQINWGYDNDSSNNVAYSIYDLTALKREAHIGFSMDLSGSMGGLFSGSNSKLDVAIEKAQLFVFLIENNQYLGVYGFSTNNIPGNTNFTTTYIGTDNLSHNVTLGDTSEISSMHAITGLSDRLAICNAIYNQSAHNCTPIGQGLLRAKKGIDEIVSASPFSPAKAIVLFSDGLQNIPPFVNEIPPESCGGNTSFVNISAQKTFTDNSIPIHSIYFGQEIGWGYDFMNQVKNQTGGQYVYGVCTELELATVYYSIRGMVDDMLYLEPDGMTSAGGPWPQFEINFDEAAGIATVSGSWELGNGETRLTIDRRQKGTRGWIENNNPIETPVTHRVPDYAHKSFEVYRFEPGPNTTWEFRVRQLSPSQGQTKFTAAVFSNVAVARIQPSIDAAEFETGKPLPVYVDLRSGIKPTTDATVTAQVKIPARSFSNLLRKYYKRFSQTQVKPAADVSRINTILPQLKRFLKEDFGSDIIYTYGNVTLTLKDDGILPDKIRGDGRYTAVLPGSETMIAGDYKITFIATGNMPSGKPYQRIATLSTICNVGPTDLGKSAVEITTSPLPRDDRQVVTFTILPVDKYGNAAFPGSVHNIKVTAKKGTPIGNVIDNLDSSFTQAISVKKGDMASVDISVSGVSLGTFTAGKSFPRHELSFHTGFVAPTGTFKKTVSDGLSLAFDYAYRFNSNLAVRGQFSLDWFKKPNGEKKLLTHFNPYLQYRLVSGNVFPYIEIGPGFYKLKNGDNALGFAAGIGIRYMFSQYLDLDVNVHGHRAGGNLDLTFIQALAGIILKF